VKATGNRLELQYPSPWSLDRDDGYARWRRDKLDSYEAALKAPPIAIENLAEPSESERKLLMLRCSKTNLALYRSPAEDADEIGIRIALRRFSDRLGLRIAERHRSAGEQGIVALRVTDAQRQRGYIPYSRNRMNWHTDGYYNAPDNQIRAMVLHCVRPADDGGENRFLDPEIAYIRLRDENPDHIRALMHPRAMTIPENREPDGSLRPESTGPVFSVDAAGRLAMRFTARTRSIRWRDDPATEAAVAALMEILNGDDPLALRARLGPGEGILCNNVLHNRTGFDPDKGRESRRLIFRIRFHNRIPTPEQTS